MVSKYAIDSEVRPHILQDLFLKSENTKHIVTICD